ncbi:cyclodeaminase/cyclohydrolase family protein [Rhizobium sp. Root482]|uniref:cyclodeaminase/cyclohydrolase family protein n=1 Tax=Rhizobium sp. Root482 TaxID=1736543 RepID=UPI0009E9390D|nr:cyclodeaminase/cyclohydrolase family protein [Rhizobium sp. Root482]
MMAEQRNGNFVCVTGANKGSTMNLFDTNLSDIFQAVGRPSPQLGGGAVSILSALLGLSLIRLALVGSVSEEGNDIARAVETLDRLTDRMKECAKADVEAFHEYVAALKLPEGGKDQVEFRDRQLLTATRKAVDIPLDCSSLVVEALDLAALSSRHVQPDIVSDLYAGASILNGALGGMFATLDINLKQARMQEVRDELKPLRAEILGKRGSAMKNISDLAAAGGYILP